MRHKVICEIQCVFKNVLRHVQRSRKQIMSLIKLPSIEMQILAHKNFFMYFLASICINCLDPYYRRGYFFSYFEALNHFLL